MKKESEPVNMFSPFSLRGVTLKNRIGLSPMVQASAKNGMPNEWHLVHLGSRASAGIGLVLTEATAVSEDGRICPGDLGIWSDAHVQGHRRIAEFIKRQGAVAGIQLAHAGRKGSMAHPYDHNGPVTLRWLNEANGGWPVGAPSPIQFSPDSPMPYAMTLADIERVMAQYETAAENAVRAGYEWLEIHAAHGYLPHCFYSPVSNHRHDSYGGGYPGRTRFVKELVARLRLKIPDAAVLAVRISYTDWIQGGWELDDSVRLAKELKAAGADLIDVSSGGTSPTTVAVMKELLGDSSYSEHSRESVIAVYEGYQVDAARRIREEAHMPVAAVGMIQTPSFANSVIAQGKADLLLLGRVLLREPFWLARAASELGLCERLTLHPQYHLGWNSVGNFNYATDRSEDYEDL
jgi:2,4-dienoyl-CoA reductase-like NADH-dependent reductase (Old Yellow Enzyme family)